MAICSISCVFMFVFLLWGFEEDAEMGFVIRVCDCRLVAKESQHLRQGDLDVGPFEDECAVWCQNAPAFSEASSDVSLPCGRVEHAVAFCEPRFAAGAFEVRRVEKNLRE